jgi:hypothetical protein
VTPARQWSPATPNCRWAVSRATPPDASEPSVRVPKGPFRAKPDYARIEPYQHPSRSSGGRRAAGSCTGPPRGSGRAGETNCPATDGGDDVNLYPGEAVLAEVGRVAIASARLDIWTGLLWHHMHPATREAEARRESSSKQVRAIRLLADERFVLSPLRTRVLHTADAVEAAQERRHEVIHQDWTLRTLERILAWNRLVEQYGDAWAEHRDEIERFALDSPNWQRYPARSLEVDEAQTLTELQAVERQLFRVMEQVQGTTAAVASARTTGQPAGYLRLPMVARQRPREKCRNANRQDKQG